MPEDHACSSLELSNNNIKAVNNIRNQFLSRFDNVGKNTTSTTVASNGNLKDDGDYGNTLRSTAHRRMQGGSRKINRTS
jgi:hypothetical protein